MTLRNTIYVGTRRVRGLLAHAFFEIAIRLDIPSEAPVDEADDDDSAASPVYPAFEHNDHARSMVARGRHPIRAVREEIKPTPPLRGSIAERRQREAQRGR